MYITFAILLSLIASVYQLKINASYTTSFWCFNGSYALIGGADLILQYDFGLSHTELESFHLYETINARHMFDYESVAGKAFIKDKNSRLKSYNWTDTGIKLMIPDIDKKKDLGKYKGDVATKRENSQNIIEIKEIHDPPTEVKIGAPSGVEIIKLSEGFGEVILNISAESYTAISCQSVTITWSSPTKGNILSCQAEDEREKTVCPLALKETDMIANNCTILEVYAEQYGVQSEQKTYILCYYVSEHPHHCALTTEYFSVSGSDPSSANGHNINIIVIVLIAVLVVENILIGIGICIKCKGKGKGKKRKAEGYRNLKEADESHIPEQQHGIEMTAEIYEEKNNNELKRVEQEASELAAKREQTTADLPETTAQLKMANDRLNEKVAKEQQCLQKDELKRMEENISSLQSKNKELERMAQEENELTRKQKLTIADLNKKMDAVKMSLLKLIDGLKETQNEVKPTRRWMKLQEITVESQALLSTMSAWSDSDNLFSEERIMAEESSLDKQDSGLVHSPEMSFTNSGFIRDTSLGSDKNYPSAEEPKKFTDNNL